MFVWKMVLYCIERQKMAEGKMSHTHASSSPTRRSRSTGRGQTNEHSLLLSSSPFIMLSRTCTALRALHRRCTNWTNTRTLWAMPVVAAHAKRLVPTKVHCRYLTCTELQLHGPVTPRNTHSELQSTLIISYLLPVPSSLLLQWRQCACDKRFQGSFNSCSLFLGFWNGERHKKGI